MVFPVVAETDAGPDLQPVADSARTTAAKRTTRSVSHRSSLPSSDIGATYAPMRQRRQGKSTRHVARGHCVLLIATTERIGE
jgi:hypothetical protein